MTRHVTAIVAIAMLPFGCDEPPDHSRSASSAKAASVAPSAAPSTRSTVDSTTASGSPFAEGAAPASNHAAISAARFGGVWTQYEAVRAALASDDLEAAKLAAQKLASAVPQSKLPAAALEHAKNLSKSANAVAEAAKPDEARRAFGDVSKHLLGIVQVAPDLKRGHVFECPMAQGYKKWVQPTAQLSNPYMGKRMLGCGGPSDWSL